jgi:hypothetical protein
MTKSSECSSQILQSKACCAELQNREFDNVVYQKHQIEKSNQKLSHKFIKSFRISKTMSKQVYRLILFSFYRIHDVFHVFYLKSYKRRKDDNVISKFFSSELLDDEEINEIEKILKKKISKKIIYYLIK